MVTAGGMSKAATWVGDALSALIGAFVGIDVARAVVGMAVCAGDGPAVGDVVLAVEVVGEMVGGDGEVVRTAGL